MAGKQEPRRELIISDGPQSLDLPQATKVVELKNLSRTTIRALAAETDLTVATWNYQVVRDAVIGGAMAVIWRDRHIALPARKHQLDRMCTLVEIAPEEEVESSIQDAVRRASRSGPIKWTPEEIGARLSQTRSGLTPDAIVRLAKHFQKQLALRATQEFRLKGRSIESISDVRDVILPSEGIVFLKAPTGSGKTQLICGYLRSEGGRSLILTPRRAIVSMYPQELAVDYRELGYGDDSSHRGAIKVCVNSLSNWNVQAWIQAGPVDTVFIDEAELMLRHLATAPVESITSEGSIRPKRRQVFNALRAVLGAAKRIVVADADLSGLSQLFYAQLAPGKTCRTLVQPTDFKGSIQCRFVRSQKHLFSEIVAAAQVGPTLVATDSKRGAARLCEELAQVGVEEVLLIKGENLDGDDQAAFLANANEQLKRWQVVVHTPAMQSSVSITHRHFQYHFGDFRGRLTAPDIIQMIRRDRTATSWMLSVVSDGPSSRFEGDELLIVPGASEGDLLAQLRAKVIGVTRRQRRWLLHSLWALLEDQGIVCEVLGRDGSSRQVAGARASSSDFDRQYVTAVLEASPESPYWKVRQRIAQTFRTNSIGELEVRLWRDGAARRHLQNLLLVEKDGHEVARLESKDIRSGAFDHPEARYRVVQAIAGALGVSRVNELLAVVVRRQIARATLEAIDRLPSDWRLIGGNIERLSNTSSVISKAFRRLVSRRTPGTASPRSASLRRSP